MSPTAETPRKQMSIPLPTFERVLFCTDFSDASRAAQQTAARLCKRRNVNLAVIHVSEYGPVPSVSGESLDYAIGLMKKEHCSLTSVVNEFHEEGIDVEPVMAEGSAASMILEEISARHIDLVVVGTQAARGLDRLLFGSTAETVFRKAPCPVLTVGPTKQPSRNELRRRPIIFATDFDDCSLDALRFAASFAEFNQSPMHVVHVLPVTVRKDNSTVPAIIKEALRLLTTYLPADGIAPRCEILQGTDVSHAVVDYAKAQNADCIVLGVRKKSSLAAHLPPHRTFRIIMTAPCPVLTIAYEPY